MINDIKNKVPSIDFGFGITAKTVATGQPVTIWLATLYNPEGYTFSLIAGQGKITVISDYEYEVTYSNSGIYELALAVLPLGKKTSLQSNILTVTVTEDGKE
jgi:hypothetical protein